MLKSWDIETNPGPDKSKKKSLSICHWNLNSMWVENFSKLTQISAFLNVYDFDIFCLSETFLDSSIADDDQRLKIDGYDLHRCDHPSNSRRGGVCLYYKSHLSLVRRSDLTDLNECLVCEVRCGSKRSFITLLYRSPSQDGENFMLFKRQWEDTIININNCSPAVSVYVGDFNARNSDWWSGDTSNLQGTEINNLATQHGLHQIIDKPTHILSNSASCIDLIFTSTPNLVCNSGVLPSLFSTCKHQLVYARLNF